MFGGLKFYERKEIKDILGYLKLIVNPDDNQAFLRVINTPPRGIGAQSIQQIVDLADTGRISYLSALKSSDSRSKGSALFLSLMTDFEKTARTKPLSELISEIVERSEYGPKLRAMKDPAAQSRVENLQELVAIGRGMETGGTEPFETLRSFLDRVSLTSSADLPNEDGTEADKTDAVSLMTLHLAKGLEFPLVFLTGAEEGLLPHYRSLLDSVAIEEERRLCYVGITRAMEELCITRAKTRGMFSSGSGFGATGMLRDVSRFIMDIPPEVIQDLSGDFFEESVKVSPVEESSEDRFGHSSWAGRGQTSSWQSGAQTNRSKPRSVSAGINPSKDLTRNYKTKFLGTPLVKPADSLKAPENHPDWSPGLSPITPEELQIGAEVIHPSFGIGTIESTDAPDTAPAKLKVAVRFRENNELKKLIFKFANFVKPFAN
jgi:DNA helicase-2/ATP-dependent DNA helicase PcrA